MKRASNISLNKHMNRKSISLDTKKADAPKKNLMMQLDVIASSLTEVHSILNRLNMKKYICEGSVGITIQAAKRCLSQAQAARTLSMNLSHKYSEDQKNLVIEDLNARIALLEERLSRK